MTKANLISLIKPIIKPVIRPIIKPIIRPIINDVYSGLNCLPRNEENLKDDSIYFIFLITIIISSSLTVLTLYVAFP